MNLYKELFDFLEANNWLSLEDEENAKGVIARYIEVYRPQLHKGQLLPIPNVVGQSEQLVCPNCDSGQIIEFLNRNKRQCQICGENWAK